MLIQKVLLHLTIEITTECFWYGPQMFAFNHWIIGLYRSRAQMKNALMKALHRWRRKRKMANSLPMKRMVRCETKTYFWLNICAWGGEELRAGLNDLKYDIFFVVGDQTSPWMSNYWCNICFLPLPIFSWGWGGHHRWSGEGRRKCWPRGGTGWLGQRRYSCIKCSRSCRVASFVTLCVALKVFKVLFPCLKSFCCYWLFVKRNRLTVNLDVNFKKENLDTTRRIYLYS